MSGSRSESPPKERLSEQPQEDLPTDEVVGWASLVVDVSRRGSTIRMVMVAAVFAVVAMHVGTPDQMAHMAGEMGFDSAPMLATANASMTVAAPVTVMRDDSMSIDVEPPRGDHSGSDGMNLVAACQLLALASFVGVACIAMLAVLRVRRTRTVWPPMLERGIGASWHMRYVLET